MPSSLALILCVVFALGLMRFDPARTPGTSPALWVPLIEFFIVGSRLPSVWLSGAGDLQAQALEDGNSLDRGVYITLILLAVGILVSRSFKWGSFFARNLTLVGFLCFALVSVTWSDFPFVTFKRWIRDLGCYLTVLVALSDARPLEAVRTLFRRLFFLLIPLCILTIKYYPEIGRTYNIWSGQPMYVGATTSKNMLGLLCLVSGLFFFWDILTRWYDRRDGRTKRIILLNVVFIAGTLWLLNISDSATPRICLGFGGVVMAAAHTNAAKNHPTLFKWLIPVPLCLFILLTYGFGVDIMTAVAQAAGRDPTLTDRTLIWKVLLSMNTNPWVGTGYETFWLGSRLQRVWDSGFHVNEAHNGYLQVYLNLGLVGLCLVLGFLIASYRYDLQTTTYTLFFLRVGAVDGSSLLQFHRGRVLWWVAVDDAFACSL